MVRLLQGERLRLRKMTLADTEKIISWRNQSFVRKNFIYQKSFTVEGHQRWVHDMIETGKAVQFIMVRTDNDRDIGSVYFRDIDNVHHKAEYGMFIGDKSSLRKGYGTEACKMACRYGFANHGWHKTFSRFIATNIPSIRSCQKAGFLMEAFLKDDVFIGEKYCDIVLMAILNPYEDALAGMYAQKGVVPPPGRWCTNGSWGHRFSVDDKEMRWAA